MSREPGGEREELLRALVREVRQANGLGASFFRVAAGQIGMNVTDLQVVDILDVMGPATAGQLAELTGLTTGAITGMLDRLEKDGYIRRERDPEDGRRVIVRLAPSAEAAKKIGPIFETVERAWETLAVRYNDEQLGLLLEFLKRDNAISREQLVRLREVLVAGAQDAAAPLGDLTRGRLVFPRGTTRLTIKGDATMPDLYRAHFEGTIPDVLVSDDGTVSIRYTRRQWQWLLLLVGEDRAADVTLNATIPWQIEAQGGVLDFNADVSGLKLLGMDIKGDASMIRIVLGEPSGTVPIRITGSAASIHLQRPQGVAVRARLKGWTSELTFDGEAHANLGNDVRQQSADYEDAENRYDIEVSGNASTVAVTTETMGEE